MNVLRRADRLGLAIILVCGLALAACGDDEVTPGEGGSADDCPVGTTWNPIEEACVEANSGGNNDSPNGSSNNSSGGNNGGGGTEPGNNGGANGGGGNNGGANNGGDPDPGNNDSPGLPGDECGTGGLTGQSCNTSGAILGGAEITLSGEDCEGQPFEETVTSANNGYFEFEDVPAGDHHIEITSGSFSGEETVTVIDGLVTDMADGGKKACISAGSVNIAVLEGSYDDVGGLLDGLDIDYDSMGSGLPFFGSNDAVDLLMDPAAMNEYDIIFIECGSLWSEMDDILGGIIGGGGDVDQVTSNIYNFVANGNSLYVSDLAQPFISESIPEAVGFYNQSSGTTAPQQGTVQSVTADVVSPEMQGLLGSNEVDIEFSSGGWAVAESAPANSTSHFEADVQLNSGSLQNSPLMVSHDMPGGGSAIFTAFHNNAQATGAMEQILEYMIFQL